MAAISIPLRSVLMDRSAAFELAQVSAEASLRDALVSLDSSSCQVVLAVDTEQRIVGLLTDGDVRRALLRGAGLNDSVASVLRADFAFVGPNTDRADVLDLMQSLRISEVPVLDEQRRLVGLHLLHDILGQRERPNAALIMAGGRGTRLAPITDSIPKPMVRVAGRPILERIVLQLVSAGIRRIYISVHYLGHLIEEHFGDGSRFGCHIQYVHEESPLGTAGALSLLPEIEKQALVLMNGDLVTQADIGDLLDSHAKARNLATMAIRRYFHVVPFGCVELDGDRVTSLSEKPTVQRIVNAGIYVVEPSMIAEVPKGIPTTMPELISRAIDNGEKIGAWEIEDDWLDVGQREQLDRARGER